MAENMNFQMQTPRLLLKELTSSDAMALFEYRSLPEITLFQGWTPTSLEDAIQFIEEDICHVMDQPDTWFQLGIFSRENQALIGDLGIHFLPDLPDVVEVGVTVAPGCQGNGVASEAVACVLDFLFSSLGKNKVTASVDPMNHKSMALMKRVGFQLDGIHKSAVLFRGEWTDDAVFIMTREKWLNHQ